MPLPLKRFYRFGDFTVDPDQRVLLRDGKPLPLTPKVFDTLLILVENSGQIVEKEELMRRLWPDSFVEEANITFNIQQLRKSLNDDARNPRYIGTVARRGYRFIADVEPIVSYSTRAGGQNGLTSRVEGQESGPAINSESESRLSSPEQSVAVTPAAAASPPGIRRRFVALAVAAVIVLACVGLFWKFSPGWHRNPGEGKSPALLPLKLEKLTVTGQSRQVAISPDGKHIAYTRQFENKQSIWVRQLATNTNIEIVPATSRVAGLGFASSGEYLYFVRVGPSVLCRVSLFGGVPMKVVDNLEGNFSVSADDKQIAIVRQATNRDGQQEYSLIIARSDGMGERTLLVGTYPDKLDAPLWSPDGESIICAYGYSEGGGQDVSIVEVRVADGTKKELAADRFFRIAKMAWSPSRSALIMSARKNLADNNQLWQISYPGLNVSRITEELSPYLDLSVATSADKAVASQATRISNIWIASSREPENLKKITQAIDLFCWTPNGRLIYTSTASGNRDLWIMRPDGAEQRQLTVNAGVNGAPAVTADSRYIVFASNRTGAFQVWRMDLDGANQIQLTNGSAKNYPAISRDGKWVIYNTADDWHLWRVSIDGGEPLQVAGYIASWPSVSPDGKRIACLGRDESKREIVILPIEGGPPLKRLEFHGANLSATRIEWTPDGQALIYAAALGEPSPIIKQSLAGGPAEQAATFDQDELFDFHYSVDGQFLAVIRGGWQHDVVLISDINR